MIRKHRILSIFRPLLVPLSGLYSLAVCLRNAHYNFRSDASRAARLPVISIGNITVGGTGKTPIVMETVRRLRELGHQPAILTRGYGAAASQTPDEVMEYAERLPEIPVVTNPDRVAAAETACAGFGADCLVLDDGFQHRRLRRDLDVVVIDALDPWGGGWVLPAGRLREPLTSLARADLLIISRSNQVASADLTQIQAMLSARAPQAETLCAAVESEAVVYSDGRTEHTDILAYHSVLPVCGLGNPSTFLGSIEPLAGRVCRALVFRDHQHYTARHVRKIIAAARRRDADLVVTTCKDWVKLATLWPDTADTAAPELARLDVRLDLQDEAGVFDKHLQRALESRA